jgi:hypothetical protein
MTILHMIYQAERPVSRSEELAADAARGELARALSSVLRGGRGRGRERQVTGDGRAARCYPPAGRVTAGAR